MCNAVSKITINLFQNIKSRLTPMRDYLPKPNNYRHWTGSSDISP